MPHTPEPIETILHASAVAVDGRSLLLMGRSGAGKSTTALHLISLGATLVADDRTHLHRDGDTLHTAPAPNIAGQIEARGVGILALPHVARAKLAMVVDLDATETDRLPSLRHIKLLGLDFPLYRRMEGPHFALSLLHCLSGCRLVP